jgi:auxin-responsive protein IAA
MSPPLLGVGEEEGQSNVALLASSASADSLCRNSSELKERNYMGLSDCSSVDSSVVSTESDESKRSTLNLKATELRLGLPGSQSPGRDPELCLLSSTQLDEKPLFPLHPLNDGHYSSSQKTAGSGSKRGFSDAMDGFSEVKITALLKGIGYCLLLDLVLITTLSLVQGKYRANSEVCAMLSPRPSSNFGLKTGSVLENLGTQSPNAKEVAPPKIVQDRPRAANEPRPSHNGAANGNSSAPATK